MLLTIDIGNTSVKLAIYHDNEEIAFKFYDGPQNDYKALIISFIFKAQLRQEAIDAAIIASVVPSLNQTIIDALETFIAPENIIDINPSEDYGIVLDVPNPDEVGDDLIVLNAYAHNLFHRNTIIISMGTCTVLTYLSGEGAFKYCIIAPGFNALSKSLWGNAELLQESNISKRDSFLANNTIDAINVGVYEGYIGMIKYLVEGMSNELGEKPYIVGCGGIGKKIVEQTDIFDYYEADLVTKGLNYLYRRRINNV